MSEEGPSQAPQTSVSAEQLKLAEQLKTENQKLKIENQKLKGAVRRLKEGYDELQLVHQGVVEHSTNMENNLDSTNSRMKKYLSPQLYKRVTGTEEETSLAHNRRKMLTIFFSDLVGFSSITDTVEPEVLSSCLNYYLDRMSKIAIKYDGTIDKFIGDAIMIFFGDSDQETPEFYAKQCVKMALDMQADMKWVNEYWVKSGISRPLQARIGINSGYTTVGNYGTEERMDYTIVGGQVNIAARLEAHAKPGTICISDSTKALVADEIETESLDEVRVKGILAPVVVHRAIGLKTTDPANRKSKYFLKNQQGEGFILDKIVYTKERRSDEELRAIRDSLEEAMRYLEGQEGQ